MTLLLLLRWVMIGELEALELTCVRLCLHMCNYMITTYEE